MRKLNNKGMTSIEVLLSFIVVVMLSVSMYTTISAYQNKISDCTKRPVEFLHRSSSVHYSAV